MNMLQLKKAAVFAFFCLLLQCSSQADYGTVTAVYDGDTLKVRFPTGKEEKIRMIGVDAPEIGTEDDQTRLKALFSKRFAFKFLYKKKVKIEYDWEKRDKYGRLLAYIWTKDGTFFNEFVIQQGFASAYTRFKYKSEYKKRFLKAEESAKKRGNGLWKKEPFPLICHHETSEYLGQLISYEFQGHRIQDKGNLLLLTSKHNDFGVTVYKKYLHLFPDLKSLLGKKILISGLLEDYQGQLQIMLFSPSQIKHKSE